jgi:oligopeptidase B
VCWAFRTEFPGLQEQAHLLVMVCSSCGDRASRAGQNTDNRIEKYIEVEDLTPPIARPREHTESHHGFTLTDPYHWLKDPGYPDVNDEEILAYLSAENSYFEKHMAPLQPLVDVLFEELKARQVLDDTGLPWREDNFWYQWRYDKQAQYRTWWRQPYQADRAIDEQAWSLYLDEPALAADLDYFRLGSMSISDDGKLLAYSTDTDGSERYRLRIRDLTTGIDLYDVADNAIGAAQWSPDGTTLFYTVVSEQWRPHQIWRHAVRKTADTERRSDTLIFEEADESFFVGMGRTQSDAYLVISSADHVTSEIHLLPLATPDQAPALVVPRRTGHEVSIDHQPGRFWILSNRDHKNFSLYVTDELTPGEEHWKPVFSGDDRHYLTGHACFADQVVVALRIDGLEQIQIRPNQGEPYLISFPQPVYSAGLGTNAMFELSELRLSYSSMTTPNTIFDYDLSNRTLVERKVQQIPSGYDATQYTSERVMVTSRDGVQIPVSLVYNNACPPSSARPLHLYAYGAYGASIDPTFSTARLSLLNRGITYAIAHVRGGDDLGYHWYEGGKLTQRTNTFNDFVDAARDLIDRNYTGAGNISISGGSAGGELMGAVVNQAPELWRAVVADVPFVDVLNTMLDASLPLTPMEWPEWGNPIDDPQAYELIQSYSPYDQLKEGAYPPMLVTAGLNDPRVTYWEPAKYVAKLRTLKTDDNILMLKTNMGAGHGGKSGRFDSLKEIAEEYAFILHTLRK